MIIVNDNNVYSCMVETIILFESVFTIYKIIKRLGHFKKKIELDFQVKEIESILGSYRVLIDELKIFLYKPICNNIIKVEPIMNKIINFKWEPRDDEFSFELNEANPFIDDIFNEICEKYDKLYLLSGGSLTEKSQQRFLDVILMHVIEKLMEAFSNVKKSNSTGRSIMMKDIKFLKSKIESKFNRDMHEFFGELDLYINSWYCSEDEFIKYIEDSHLNYKYLPNILSYGQNFSKLSRNQRKDFNTKIDETYWSIIENVKISMLE